MSEQLEVKEKSVVQEKLDLLEKDILNQLPQVPMIIDQVGHAIKWVREVEDEGKVFNTLTFARSVEDYVNKISERDFYKTYLVIGALLLDVENVFEDERFKVFQTASGEVEKILRAIKLDEELQKERGSFKGLTLQLAKMAKENEEYFSIYLLSILTDLNEISDGMKEVKVKTPITAADYVKILGYAYVVGNIEASNFSMLDNTGEILNKIRIELNETFNF